MTTQYILSMPGERLHDWLDTFNSHIHDNNMFTTHNTVDGDDFCAFILPSMEEVARFTSVILVNKHDRVFHFWSI